MATSRPSQHHIWVVTHSYTGVYWHGAVETTTEHVGAYLSGKNALLAAVSYIEASFDVTFTDKDDWKNGEYDPVEGDEAGGIMEEEDDDDDQNKFTVNELNASGEFVSENEDECDKHTVQIECIAIKDA